MVVPLHLQFIILLCDGCFVGLCGIENRGEKQKPTMDGKKQSTTTTIKNSSTKKKSVIKYYIIHNNLKGMNMGMRSCTN